MTYHPFPVASLIFSSCEHILSALPLALTQSRNGIQTASSSDCCHNNMCLPNIRSSTIAIVLHLFYIQSLPAFLVLQLKVYFSFCNFNFIASHFHVCKYYFSSAFFVDHCYDVVCFTSFLLLVLHSLEPLTLCLWLWHSTLFVEPCNLKYTVCCLVLCLKTFPTLEQIVRSTL